MRLLRICIGASTLAFGMLVLGTGSAVAASPCPPGPGFTPPGPPPQYPMGLCRLALSRGSARPGQSMTASGGGYRPGSSVVLGLGPAGSAGGGGGRGGRSLTSAVGMPRVQVAQATAGADGRVTLVFAAPDAAGQYEVDATGVDPNGEAYELSAPLRVVAASAVTRTAAVAKPSGGLARTGINPLAPAGAGLALAAGGLGLTLVARRRKATAA